MAHLVEAQQRGVQGESYSAANPAGQVPSKLRVDTCRVGLCPTEVCSSLTSALDSWVKKEAGLVMGSDYAH
ncbi:UNVERIFIED_CONTAM: hypothetical protein FKN15_051789 [Acipenser sinensis]